MKTQFALGLQRSLPSLLSHSYRPLSCVALAVAFSSPLTLCTSCSEEEREADLSILYVTDVHGLLLEEDFLNSNGPSSSMAKFSTYANLVRDSKGADHTILLCGGDLNDGLPLLYYYNNYGGFEEHISPAVMNYLEFDAIQLGASDMALGMDVWMDILPAQYKMPYMCSNLLDNKTEMPPFPSYTIIEKAGMRIAVIGLLDPNDCNWLGPEDIQGYHVGDVTVAASKWAQKVRAEEKADYVIALASVGTRNQKLLNVPGIDLFLMGSDHRSLLVDDYRVNSAGDTILVVQPKPRVAECARIDLHLHKKGTKTVSCQTEVQRVPLSTLKPDSVFVAEFEPQVEIVNTYLSEPIGFFSGPVSYSDALFGPSAWVDIKHDVQLWSTGAEISITNIGSEVGDLHGGEFTMRDLFHFINNDYKLWVVPMTGAEVKAFLESAAAVQFNQMTSPNDHILAFRMNEINEVMIGDNGPELVQDKDKYCSAAGIKYTVDVTKPVGHRVEILSMSDGSRFYPLESYRVAIPDYLAVGGGRYVASLGWNQETALRRQDFTSAVSLRTHFINYLKAKQKIDPKSREDWKVIPAAYAKSGIDRDYQVMKRYVQ